MEVDLFNKPYIQQYIKSLTEERNDEMIAKSDEVLMFYNAFSNKDYSLNIPSIIILYPIMIIGVLISNEIIIIHPYQLDFYTSDKINERADSILDRDMNTINLLAYGGVDQEKEEKQEDEIEENIIN